MKQNALLYSLSSCSKWTSVRISSIVVAILAICVSTSSTAAQAATSTEDSSGCIACHKGIESIRDPNSEMMQEISVYGRRLGDSAGCTVCHGGDPEATSEEQAHQGRAFYPDPGSPWINKLTCGQCHSELVKAQWNSLMMTEAGKIQGAAWAFGSLKGTTIDGRTMMQAIRTKGKNLWSQRITVPIWIV